MHPVGHRLEALQGDTDAVGEDPEHEGAPAHAACEQLVEHVRDVVHRPEQPLVGWQGADDDVVIAQDRMAAAELGPQDALGAAELTPAAVAVFTPLLVHAVAPVQRR
jgi:hypothetical protein